MTSVITVRSEYREGEPVEHPSDEVLVATADDRADVPVHQRPVPLSRLGVQSPPEVIGVGGRRAVGSKDDAPVLSRPGIINPGVTQAQAFFPPLGVSVDERPMVQLADFLARTRSRCGAAMSHRSVEEIVGLLG
jgi:hypothetical protein